MITTSTAYDTSIVAPSRQTSARVLFQLVDVTASGDASITVTSESAISQKDQLVDEELDATVKPASFEFDFWQLDGTFALPDTTGTGQKTGYISGGVSGADGTFAVNQVVTIDFTTDHSSIGFTIIFDRLTGDCAKDFTVDVYDSGASLIHSESVTNNTNVIYILEQNLPNYRQIVITFTKTLNPYRRATIIQMIFGIYQEYNGDELISLNVLKNIDPTMSESSADEIKYTIDNSDKLYNMLNPGGYFQFLQRQQKIFAKIGAVLSSDIVEYINCGTYYLTDWKNNEQSLTATFTARDILNILNDSKYMKSTYQTRSLTNLATDVLTDAGLSSSDYSIDTALNSINVTGYIPIMSHKEALQMIAMAGESVLYADRDGIVTIKQLGTTPVAGYDIDFDNMYASPETKLDKLVNTVSVPIATYNARASSEEVYKGTFTLNGTQDVWIMYKEEPCQSVSAVVSGGTLNSATYYGGAAVLNITAAGSITITATGTVLDKSETMVTVVSASKLSSELTQEVIVDNPLIGDETVADNVADYILAELEKRLLYTVNWRQNPAFECGDILPIEDEFSENKNVRITEQKFTFDGALRGQTKGRAG